MRLAYQSADSADKSDKFSVSSKSARQAGKSVLVPIVLIHCIVDTI